MSPCCYSFSGKATLSSLTSSQSVSFRHGTNVEFNAPGFQGGAAPPGANVTPIDAYNLETLNNKNRDFSNPMYDAVQSGTNHEPTVGNGSGES